MEHGIRAANRARHEERILDAARRALVDKGPSALTLRGVASEVGMAPSAIYRYYDGLDALLTALIIEAYRDVGEAARTSAAASAGAPAERAVEVCLAVRAWAKANRHRYALIYGTPMPGYAAPQDTIDPASEVAVVLISLLRPSADAPGGSAGLIEPETAEALGLTQNGAVAAVRLWTGLFGMISFELFGHWNQVVADADGYFEAEVRRLVAEVEEAV